MFAADRGVKQLEATSHFRARPCLEWSKQISRDAVPYFSTSPTPNPRQSSGSEGPQRHRAVILLDRIPGRDVSPTFGGGRSSSFPPRGSNRSKTAMAQADDESELLYGDTRDYNPYDYESRHRHCPVDWKRAPARVTMSGGNGCGGSADASVLDPFVYPGWGRKGQHSNLPKAARDPSALRAVDRTTPLTESELNSSTVLNACVTRRTPGGPMSKAVREASVPILTAAEAARVLHETRKEGGGGAHSKSGASNNNNNGPSSSSGAAGASSSTGRHDDTAEHAAAARQEGVERGVSYLSRNRGNVSLEKSTARDRPKKLSESYQEILRSAATPPPVGPKMRITQGFAPMRANHRLTLHDLLGQTSKDVTRARSVTGSCFGERSRSELRTAALYTPPPE